MRVTLYPITISALLLLVGYSFYSLYHTAAPLDTPPTQTYIEPIEPSTIQKELTLDSNSDATTQKITEIKLPKVAKEIAVQITEASSDMVEEPTEVFAALTPESYEETMGRAEESFAYVQELSEQMQEDILEEEANRQIETP